MGQYVQWCVQRCIIVMMGQKLETHLGKHTLGNQGRSCHPQWSPQARQKWEPKSDAVVVLAVVASIMLPFFGVACVNDFFHWAQVSTLRLWSDCTSWDFLDSLCCFDCGFFFCHPDEHWTKKPKLIWMSCQQLVASVVSALPQFALCSLAWAHMGQECKTLKRGRKGTPSTYLCRSDASLLLMCLRCICHNACSWLWVKAVTSFVDGHEPEQGVILGVL